MGAPVYLCDPITGICSISVSPPTVGSGIRALTHDPDEAGPLLTPVIGDLYIFAPSGELDAGAAGISGGKGYIGAQSVVNVANFSFSTPSVGLATPSQGISLGNLGGSSSMSAATNVMQDSAMMASTEKESEKSTQPIEEIMKWVDVKVISFDLGSRRVGEQDTEQN
jgi:hypothetical protein